MKNKNKDKSITIERADITTDEYINFLKTSDLGEQYPQENFKNRITKLVKNISISVITRNEHNEVIGICFGLTDFAYWLHITDLGVSRDYVKMGIGRKMMLMSLDIAGGEDDIMVFAYSHPSAIPFYEKLGMKRENDMMKYSKVKWTSFEVK